MKSSSQMIIGACIVAWLSITARATPAIYWKTVPVHSEETVVVAGADLANVSKVFLSLLDLSSLSPHRRRSLGSYTPSSPSLSPSLPLPTPLPPLTPPPRSFCARTPPANNRFHKRRSCAMPGTNPLSLPCRPAAVCRRRASPSCRAPRYHTCQSMRPTSGGSRAISMTVPCSRP